MSLITKFTAPYPSVPPIKKSRSSLASLLFLFHHRNVQALENLSRHVRSGRVGWVSESERRRRRKSEREGEGVFLAHYRRLFTPGNLNLLISLFTFVSLARGFVCMCDGELSVFRRKSVFLWLDEAPYKYERGFPFKWPFSAFPSQATRFKQFDDGKKVAVGVMIHFVLSCNFHAIHE